ncbi:MAG: integrase core domain-containing protein, partial [Paracoccaceae bacterium]
MNVIISSAIDFIDHIIEKFPLRIREVRTDNGHEFQAKFHWHVEDLGIRHAYIKRGTPQLNGKVERSHRSDQQEFYQLLSYKDDVDLEAKLAEWEKFYNFARPHGAHNGPLTKCCETGYSDNISVPPVRLGYICLTSAPMEQKPGTRRTTSEKIVKDIQRATRKQYSSEEKIRIVLDGLRGEDSIAELCRREGISQGIYYKWSKDFMEAGKR